MSKGEGTKFVPYEFAKQIVRYYQIKSRAQYRRWHEQNNIQYLPRFPNRVYEQWEGWNMFLGQNNSFDQMIRQPINYRPFWEAVRWAQSAAVNNRLKTRNDWIEFHREGNVPTDIPRYPDHVYEEFIGTGWTVWLGQTVQGKLQSERQQIGLFAVMKDTSYVAENMYVIKLFRNGESEGREYLQHYPHLKVVRAFKWDSDCSDIVEQTLNTFCTHQGDNVYMVHDVNQLLFEFTAQLLPWQR